ncbi:MAG: hypothetical protein JW888_15120 [Pirellulales bacterium]|nr:hypothetical protein [Pirellulales bacterium]
MRRDSTLSFFRQRPPDGLEHVMPVAPAAANRRLMKELRFIAHEGPTTWADFAKEHIHSTPLDTVFFLDSSFLHRREIPVEIFDALLSRKIAITSLIWGEMQDWIADPFANASFRDVLVNAKRKGSSSVLFLDPEEWPAEICETVRYYVSLLSARKYLARHLRREYAEKHETELSIEKLTSIIQSSVGDRGFVLAKKGLRDYGKPNFSADEDLVVAGVTHAILTGHETVILTRDRDPLEQFRKFGYLLDTHYRSSLIAEAFSDTPENLLEQVSPGETPHDCVEPGDRCILDLPPRFTEWVLPRNASPVTVDCHRLAGDGERMKIASLRFGFQREMLRLLEIKGKTGGRNTDLLDGRNCHLAISPPFIPKVCRNAIIGRDRRLECGPFTGPLVDLQYALQEVQRFRLMAIDESLLGTSWGSTGMKLADFCLAKRLNFASDAEWTDIEWEELSKAIYFFDAAASFWVDRGVMLALRHDVRETLVSRGFGWSTSIRDSTLVRHKPTASGRATLGAKPFRRALK